MAYTTLAEVKTFCQVSGNGDDTLLGAIQSAAEAWIEKVTQRKFDAASASDQTFSRLNFGESRFDGKRLYFYSETADDLVSITDSPTVLMIPENGPPYYGCMLTDGAWAYPTVTVNAYWGYSKTPPADIELAVWRICKWMYDMQDTQSGDLVITPEGRVLIPEGVPSDIMSLVEPYIKVVVA